MTKTCPNGTLCLKVQYGQSLPKRHGSDNFKAAATIAALYPMPSRKIIKKVTG